MRSESSRYYWPSYLYEQFESLTPHADKLDFLLLASIYHSLLASQDSNFLLLHCASIPNTNFLLPSIYNIYVSAAFSITVLDVYLANNVPKSAIHPHPHLLQPQSFLFMLNILKKSLSVFLIIIFQGFYNFIKNHF